MGYTHYWYRDDEIEQEKFNAIAEDFKKVVAACNEKGIKICNWDGEGEPTINADEINFNGDTNCGHEKVDLGIAWPAHEGQEDGTWFGGALLSARECGGDCAHENARLKRVFKKEYDRQEKYPDGWFACCKTAYKPYDVAVTAFLVIVKHHLGDEIKISSDGEESDWDDARKLCMELFGWGDDFKIEVDPEDED